MPKNFSWYLTKMDRIAAWTLLATMVLYFISGYGMTKGIIPYQLAINIHNNWLPLILLGSFCFHSCYAISVAFKRWRIWTPVTRFLLLSFYVIFLGVFLLINAYHQQPSSTTGTTAQSTTTATGSSNGAAGVNSQSSTTRTFTASELSQYNGQNGQPAYVAISGKVYDVSGIFVNGNHHGCNPGQDVTTAFYQIHNSSFLTGLTVVGTYTG